ncbi:MAG: hypothetical protein H6732_18380 [Alphaproteobacteria bacterium]|nr:hypothetical protein [Alphaproteobacteria bacterium]
MDPAARVPFRSPLAAGLLLLPVWVGWSWFIQDDAFITFRYARNLAEGHGLVWEPGSDEYGFTSFLYTLLMGGMFALGLPERLGSALLTVAGYVGLLAGVAVLVRDRLGDRAGEAPLAAVLAVGLHYTVAAYASAGMETSLATAFVVGTWAAGLHRPEPSWRTGTLAGVLAAAALLTRLGTAVVLLPLYLHLTVVAVRARRPAGLLLATAIPTATVLALLAWAQATYGQPLPTSFYAKTSSGWVVPQGLGYLAAYLLAEWVGLLMVGGLLARLRGAPVTDLLLLAPAATKLLWVLYIGGDFMEFRFLVTVIAFVYAWLAIQLGRRGDVLGVRLLATVGAVAALWHGTLYNHLWLRLNGVETQALLSRFVDDPDTGWLRTGEVLGELFHTGSPDDVHVALTAAGAIPYASRLPTTDQLLLNSKHGLPTALPFAEQAGHRLRVSAEFLDQQGVHLLLSEIFYDCLGDELGHPDVPFELRGLAIPVSEECNLLAWYARPHPAIDAALARGAIREVPLPPPEAHAD